MARPSSKSLTQAEQRVMQVLWEKGEAPVRVVVEALEKTRPVAYNTVLTILGILHRKKYVHYRSVGRAHVYRPAVSQAGARGEAFDQLVTQFFGGSKNAFAQYLIDEEKIDARELQELKELTAGANKKRKPSND